MERAELKKACKKYKELRYVGALASSGVTANIDLDIIKKAWDISPYKRTKHFIGCYAGYITTGRDLIEKKNWKYYVAYSSMPIWFPKMVEEFNEFYDNINLEILEFKTTNLEFTKKKIRDYYLGSKYLTKIVVKYSNKRGQKKVCMPLVKFNYADGYSPEAKYIFNYNMVILLRMLCPSEKFTDLFYSPRGSKMKYLTKVNNDNEGYRSFSEIDITLEGLKKFDDIELVNSKIGELDVKNRYIKQTGIYKAVTREKRKKEVKEIKKVVKIAPVFIGNCQCPDCKRMRGET